MTPRETPRPAPLPKPAPPPPLPKAPKPLPKAAVLRPALTDFRAAVTAHRTDRHTRHKAMGAGGAWQSDRGAETLLRAREAAAGAVAHALRAAMLGDYLGLPAPLVLHGGGFPAFLRPAYEWEWPRRLLDHPTVYRVAGRPFQACRHNTVATGEPYLPGEQVPAALADWSERLAPLGLVVRQLPRAWLLHAPDNPTSHVFVVGSPSLLG